jgi:hypothetical protein
MKTRDTEAGRQTEQYMSDWKKAHPSMSAAEYNRKFERIYADFKMLFPEPNFIEEGRPLFAGFYN